MRYIYLISSFSILLLFHLTATAQTADDKDYSLRLGVGYFAPMITESGVAYDNATFDPRPGSGVSISAGLDRRLGESFSLGLGLQMDRAWSEYIRDVTVGESLVEGYLEAGGVENMEICLHGTYAFGDGESRPFVRLGAGYFTQEVELGDVPLELTGGVETEIFPDFKSAGFGLMPEVGLSQQRFDFSVSATIPLDELSGETVKEGFVSPGTVRMLGLQVKAAYRVLAF